jgi:hypothetical protein
MNVWSRLVWCLLAMFCLPVPVLSMWHVCVLLLKHYLGAAECVVASGVFCNIYINIYIYICDIMPQPIEQTSIRTRNNKGGLPHVLLCLSVMDPCLATPICLLLRALVPAGHYSELPISLIAKLLPVPSLIMS